MISTWRADVKQYVAGHSATTRGLRSAWLSRTKCNEVKKHRCLLCRQTRERVLEVCVIGMTSAAVPGSQSPLVLVVDARP